MDSNGLPIGLTNTIKTISAGEGELTLALRHMPLENSETIKIEGLAEEAQTEGFANIPGANDVSITLPLSIQ